MREPPVMYYEQMWAWEAGELSYEDTVSLFQLLIDSGLAWTLQGCYGRQAMALVDAGACTMGRIAV